MAARKEGSPGWEKQEELSRADGNGLCQDRSVSYKGCVFAKMQWPAQIRSVHVQVHYTSRKIFYMFFFFLKGNIKKLFLCSLTPKSWLSACSPCRIETSRILWHVTCGPTIHVYRTVWRGWHGMTDTNTATPYINATKTKRVFYS